jgi:nucleotide-binding universal stress UspA family protein
MAALDLARDLAIANAAKLYLLHVAAIPPADMDSPVPIAENPRWEREAIDAVFELEAGQGAAAQAALSATAGFKVCNIVRFGFPYERQSQS